MSKKRSKRSKKGKEDSDDGGKSERSGGEDNLDLDDPRPKTPEEHK